MGRVGPHGPQRPAVLLAQHPEVGVGQRDAELLLGGAHGVVGERRLHVVEVSRDGPQPLGADVAGPPAEGVDRPGDVVALAVGERLELAGRGLLRLGGRGFGAQVVERPVDDLPVAVERVPPQVPGVVGVQDDHPRDPQRHTSILLVQFP
jgi:hypothetical protein